MRLAIMQPYFLPYIGYFQLISSVDVFIVYDNIKYTKKGWINRNRILQNGADVLLSLPLKKDSDFLNIVEREIAKDFNPDKLLKKIKDSYVRAPYFVNIFPLIERIMWFEDRNLFRFIYHSIAKICEYLKISTKMRISSDIIVDHELKNKNKVIALCNASGAETYINTVGGMKLYEKDEFKMNEIDLKFIKLKPFVYKQFGNEFVPCLSIIDVMMFTPLDVICECISFNYELI